MNCPQTPRQACYMVRGIARSTRNRIVSRDRNAKHKTVFGIGHETIVAIFAIARRQKWIDIDQSQSVKLFLATPDLKTRIVQWSDEDQCYIGYCPDLYFGGISHGDSEEETYAELCSIVRDEIVHRLEKGESLPKPTVRATKGPDFAAA